MNADDDLRQGDEVEVTDEMFEAGVDAMYSELNGWDEATRAERRSALTKAFAAMARLSKQRTAQ